MPTRGNRAGFIMKSLGVNVWRCKSHFVRCHTHYPAAVLDQRNKSLTQAAAEVETAAADVDGGRKSNPKKKVSEDDRRLAQQGQELSASQAFRGQWP
eukprot:COSAG02_NODE_1648_length_11502_cov_30.464439_10_plen_97_part_00